MIHYVMVHSAWLLEFLPFTILLVTVPLNGAFSKQIIPRKLGLYVCDQWSNY